MGTIDNLKNPRTFASSFWCQRERKGGQNRRIAGYLNLEKEIRIKWQITADNSRERRKSSLSRSNNAARALVSGVLNGIYLLDQLDIRGHSKPRNPKLSPLLRSTTCVFSSLTTTWTLAPVPRPIVFVLPLVTTGGEGEHPARSPCHRRNEHTRLPSNDCNAWLPLPAPASCPHHSEGEVVLPHSARFCPILPENKCGSDCALERNLVKVTFHICKITNTEIHSPN